MLHEHLKPVEVVMGCEILDPVQQYDGVGPFAGEF